MLLTRTRFSPAMPASRSASSNDCRLSRCFPVPRVKNICFGTNGCCNDVTPTRLVVDPRYRAGIIASLRTPTTRCSIGSEATGNERTILRLLVWGGAALAVPLLGGLLAVGDFGLIEWGFLAIIGGAVWSRLKVRARKGEVRFLLADRMGVGLKRQHG